MSNLLNNILNTAAYYFIIVMPIACFIFLFGYFYTPVTSDDTLSQTMMFIARLFWLTSAIAALINFVGLVAYGPQDKRNHRALHNFNRKGGWTIKKQLIVAYVSRGDNAEALLRSVVNTEEILIQRNVKYRIEVITDMSIDISSENFSKKVRFNVVPPSYVTPNGAKYKARALEYLLRKRLYRFDKNNNWVLHLDEESIMHPSVIAGIREFIAQRKNHSTVGQGEIKYNAYNYGSNIFITSLDAIRTGDDLGRFRLQFELFKKPLFGMHGSYVLVPLKVEKDIGFDLGGKGSITEDAYFALLASTKYKFGWVDGYIQEQSPFSISAVIKQRRRWFNGLALLSFDTIVPLGKRVPLIAAMTLWAVGWISPLVAVMNLIHKGYFPTELLMVAVISQGIFASIYAIGAYRNTQDLDWSKTRKNTYIIASILLMPISAAVEAIAIIYGIIKPVKTFDVVDKNNYTQILPIGVRMMNSTKKIALMEINLQDVTLKVLRIDRANKSVS